MNVAANPLCECREQVSLGRLKTRVLHNWLHFMINLVQIIKGINVRNIPRVQDVINVFKEELALDLRVRKEKHDRDVLYTSLYQTVFDVVSPFRDTIVLRELNLKQIVFSPARRSALYYLIRYL